MDIFFTVAELALIAATLLPLSRSGVWWIRTLDFPRIQIAILAAGVLAADLALRTAGGASAPVIRAALALCFLYQLYQIRPYTMFAGKEVQPAKAARRESTLSLLLANVKMENRNAVRLREIIAAADPDIVLVVEADAWWASELDALVKSHPFSLRQPQDNTYGMMLYSKLELLHPEVRFLVEDDVPLQKVVLVRVW